MIKEIESLNEFQTLNRSGKVVIFYFWATWCGPCKLLTPLFAKIAKETIASTQEIEFYRVNIDELAAVGQEAEIKSMPTIVMYKDGNKVDSFIGAIPRKLDALITKGISLIQPQQPSDPDQKPADTQPPVQPSTQEAMEPSSQPAAQELAQKSTQEPFQQQSEAQQDAEAQQDGMQPPPDVPPETIE